MNNTVGIVEAWMSSTRLPGKVMKKCWTGNATVTSGKIKEGKKPG